MLTGDVCLREYLDRIGITKDEPIFGLCNGERETNYHLVFECVALEQWKLSLLPATNLLTRLPERDLPHSLTNLVKGTNLFK